MIKVMGDVLVRSSRSVLTGITITMRDLSEVAGDDDCGANSPHPGDPGGGGREEMRRFFGENSPRDSRHECSQVEKQQPELGSGCTRRSATEQSGGDPGAIVARRLSLQLGWSELVRARLERN